MEQILSKTDFSNTITPAFLTSSVNSHQGIFEKFLTWCAGQERNRMLWLALTYLGQIGVALPCTLFAILVLAGNNFSLWVLACVVNTPVLAITLAAQPTKITLPALFFSWVVNAMIIIFSLIVFLIQ